MISFLDDFEILPVSSLEKVYGKKRPQLFESENTMFKNERFSFQVAYRSVRCRRVGCKVTVTAEGLSPIVRAVDLTPSSYPKFETGDDYYESDEPVLLPDVLTPTDTIYSPANLWRSVFITIDNPKKAGVYKINVKIDNSLGDTLGETDYTLTVLDENLPENDLLIAEWMHYDCISDYYHLPVFSSEFDKMTARYIENAVKHGLTMLYTPIFTPALDTEIGGERTTVQLVGISLTGGKYSFDFSKLSSFIDVATSLGVKYFEIAHLFSQWGAAKTPKIMVTVDGEYKKLFGWETDALSDEYVAFLTAFLPALKEFLESKGVYKKSYFHISDEPHPEHIEHYNACKKVVKSLLPDCVIVDALSAFAFYENGVVDMPFVGSTATEPFLATDKRDWGVYYCCTQGFNFVSNRFISMPSERNRILGTQLFINNSTGFLQWGFNFWNSQLSKKRINPFAVTDSIGAFESGDGFVVYPGEDGPIDSIRNEIFAYGIEDYRALKLLESKIGKKGVVTFLKENGVKENYKDYPKSSLWLINLRKKINEMIIKK